MIISQGIKRCAVYTRKSCEDGLELEYNSLDAQYDAAAAYIKSQSGNGWQLLQKRYDDGGFSGGNVNRPALKDLLDDIDAGLVDIVVVYKIDRLSRKLTDFADLTRRFEVRNVSFVSVTQQIDTSNAAGRMMLNILMSFSQFEREMTADRIRDKIGATKRKGLWTGGPVPLGYRVVDKRLVKDEETAPIVQFAFRRYAETASAKTVAGEIQRQFGPRPYGFRCCGGTPWRMVHVYKILRNAVYKGVVPYRRTGEEFKGVHEALVDETLWSDCQRILGETVGRRRPKQESTNAMLKGLLKCGHCGGAMTPTYTTKRKGMRYSYYRCVSASKLVRSECPVRSLSCEVVEKQVIKQMGLVLKDPAFIRLAAESSGCGESEVRTSLSDIPAFFGRLFPPERSRLLHCLVEEVVVREDGIDIEFKTGNMKGFIGEMMHGDNK